MTSKLLDGWLAVWNGDLDRIPDLVTPDFRVHAAMMDGGDGRAVSGPDGLAGWIAQARGPLTDLTYAIEVGPIAQGDLLAVRWLATATYRGGFPGAAAEIGTPIAFAGTDILRIAGDRLAEYWVNSDMHVLVAQLKVSAP